MVVNADPGHPWPVGVFPNWGSASWVALATPIIILSRGQRDRDRPGQGGRGVGTRACCWGAAGEGGCQEEGWGLCWGPLYPLWLLPPFSLCSCSSLEPPSLWRASLSVFHLCHFPAEFWPHTVPLSPLQPLSTALVFLSTVPYLQVSASVSPSTSNEGASLPQGP